MQLLVVYLVPLSPADQVGAPVVGVEHEHVVIGAAVQSLAGALGGWVNVRKRSASRLRECSLATNG